MTPNRIKNTPEWREFEKLVVRIEGALIKHGAKVQSPDRIRSLFTNRLREVDASIRAKIGTTEILITLECRKRRAKQDATWLEQLGNKKTALGAAKTIAVSTSPFSSDAIKLANIYGIDLRVVRDIIVEDIESWILPQSVIHLFKHSELLEPPNVAFEMLKGEKPDDYKNPKSTGLGASVFINAEGKNLSFNDLWNIAERQLGLYDKIPNNGKVVKVQVKLDVADDLKVITSAGPRLVKQITFQCALSWKMEEIQLSQAKMVEYENAVDPSVPSIIRAEFETKEASKNNLRLGFQTTENLGELTISAEIIGNDSKES